MTLKEALAYVATHPWPSVALVAIALWFVADVLRTLFNPRN